MGDLSSVVAVAINVIFIFATISFVSASATDALASLLGWRAKLLWDSVKDLLDDPEFTGLAKKMYNNPLINPLANAQIGSSGGDDTRIKPVKIDTKSLPGAIDSRVFGQALLNVLGVEQIAQKISAASDIIGQAEDPTGAATRKALSGFVKEATEHLKSNEDLSEELKNLAINMLLRNAPTSNSIEMLMIKMIQEIANWYDFSQVRVAAIYRQRARGVNFAIALILAAILNLQPIPFGRQPLSPGFRYAAIFLEWLIIASSTLFGGPFWFEILKRVSVGIVQAPTPPKPTAGHAGQAADRDA